MQEPLISLVVTTLNRTTELDRLLHSVREQNDGGLELIVVDQNEDDRLKPIIAKYAHDLSVRHAASGRGSSHGKNAGLALATGDIIGFPDDDCAYPPDLIARVRRFFAADDRLDILTGKAEDWEGVPVGRWDEKAGPIARDNVWRRGIMFAMFFRRRAVDRIGWFDEQIGPGSATRFGCGEETDLLLRGLDLGLRTHYDPSLVVRHPNKQFTDFGVARAFGYGAGMGYVLRKNACGRQLPTLLVRPLGGAFVALVRGRPVEARYHARTLQGRLWGYINGPRPIARRGGESSPPMIAPKPRS